MPLIAKEILMEMPGSVHVQMESNNEKCTAMDKVMLSIELENSLEMPLPPDRIYPSVFLMILTR